MTQHFTAVIYKEMRPEGPNGIAHGSQVSMWETGTMVPMVTSFILWANALGCDVLLAPRHELPEWHDPGSDIQDEEKVAQDPEWSHV